MNTTFKKRMRLLFSAAALLLTNLAFAQTAKLQLTAGIHYTGGLSYDMEHDMPSAQIGAVYTPKKALPFMHNVSVSGHYYYDFLNERPEVNYNDFYVLRLQFAKEVVRNWSLTYYAGYVNSFDNNLMKSFTGEFRTNLAYGIGIQTSDDYVTGEILYESVAGYPHLSVGVNVNIVNLLKKRSK